MKYLHLRHMRRLGATTIVNRDGVHLGNGAAWTAWSRRADAQWLADQADGPVGGSGARGGTAAPAPSTDLYRWPGFMVVDRLDPRPVSLAAIGRVMRLWWPGRPR